MSPDADERLHVALLTFLESAERGAPVDREALLTDYPDLNLELRDFLDTYALVERVAAPVRELARDRRGLAVPISPGAQAGGGRPWGLPPPGDVSAGR